MGDMLKLICWAVIGLFRSRVSLEVRFVTKRNVLRRTSPERLALSNFDRQVFASPYWIAPRVVNALMIRKAGDGYPLASCWFSFVLAMEVAMSRRQTKVPRPLLLWTVTNGRRPRRPRGKPTTSRLRPRRRPSEA
jgi:hypothetical protein